MTKIVKRKITGFFKPTELSIIKQAIHDNHNITSNVSLLIKTFYIRWIEKKFKDINDKPKDFLTIDEDLLHIASLVVQRKKYSSRGGKKSQENHKNYRALEDTFNFVYGKDHQGFQSQLSLSQILSYGLQNLLTAYENNIKSNYLSYCKRFIKCHLLQNGIEKKQAKKISWIISNHFMYDCLIKDEIRENPFIQNNMILFSKLFPNKDFDEKPLVYDIEVNPFKFLPYMIKMNQAFETSFLDVNEKDRKLFNPFPLHTSFITMHTRFDTSGIAQLLMDQEKIKDFANLYDIAYGYKPCIQSKRDLLSTSSKLFPKRKMTPQDEHQYATEIWNYLTNLKTCKQKKEIYHTVKNTQTEYVFDNAIVTDGISISFQVTPKNDMKRKCKRKMKPKR
jgi:hypothetical protein